MSVKFGHLDAPGVTVTICETETQWVGECSDCGWRTVGPSEEYVSVWCEGHTRVHAALERGVARRWRQDV